MRFKPWWKLNEIEKSRRSYLLAPFCLFILLLPKASGFADYWKYTIAFAVFSGFILQGYIYKRKYQQSNQKKDA